MDWYKNGYASKTGQLVKSAGSGLIAVRNDLQNRFTVAVWNLLQAGYLTGDCTEINSLSSGLNKAPFPEKTLLQYHPCTASLNTGYQGPL